MSKLNENSITRNDATAALNFPSSNTVTLETASTERLRVDSSGNVGIGTTSPDVTLDVNGNVQFGDGGGFDMNINGTRHQFSIGGSEKMRLDSDGNLGIGTTSPSGLLHISGDTCQLHFTDEDDSSSSRIYQSGATFAIDVDQADAKASSVIAFKVDNAEAMRIDSSGNVGIGTTSPSKLLDVNGAGSFADDVNVESATDNYVLLDADGRVSVRRTDGDTNSVFEGRNSSATLTTKITAAGAATFASGITLTDGSLSVTRTDDVSWAGEFNCTGTRAYGVTINTPNNSNSSSVAFKVKDNGVNTVVIKPTGAATFNGDVTIGVGGTITAAGNATFAGPLTTGAALSAGSGVNIYGGGSIYIQQDSAGSANKLLIFKNGNSSEVANINGAGGATFAGNVITGDFDYSATGVGGVEITANGYINAQRINTGSSDGHALYQGYHGNVMTFITRADGDVENANNSYGQYSDIKLKENVVDASSQWNNIKDIRVRNFNFIEGQTHTQIGVIAQEIETVSPGLVSESPDTDKDGNDLGTVTKSVKYSVLYMKAVKALQEAMAKIETLETKVAALEAT